MHDTNTPAAWLERHTGERIPIKGSCSIGRSPSNEIVLPDERVSRRHSLVHVQEQNEFWLVDLGSSNGTYLNLRRVSQPVRLRDRDRIQIGQFSLTFHQPTAPRPLAEPSPTEHKTLQDIKAVPCWLLVADIESSTQLSQSMSADEWPVITGRWLAECKQIIEECGGSINKFLGDGFLAYWTDREKALSQVVRALEALKRLQAHGQPSFRVVIHFGQVLMGGVVSLGEESLLGREVNFVFRMEKLASLLREKCLASEAAQARLESQLALTELGAHALPGFDGQFPFYGF